MCPGRCQVPAGAVLQLRHRVEAQQESSPSTADLTRHGQTMSSSMCGKSAAAADRAGVSPDLVSPLNISPLKVDLLFCPGASQGRSGIEQGCGSTQSGSDRWVPSQGHASRAVCSRMQGRAKQASTVLRACFSNAVTH